VLFVCLGNAVRSQMAEAFARKYGSDVMEPYSAGLAPAASLATYTLKVMADRGVDVSEQYPKSIYEAPGGPWDVIVNISGAALPVPLGASVLREWTVADPVMGTETMFVATADRIETLVMRLVLEMRRAASIAPVRPEGWV
jgi:arsenate reductase